MKSAEVLVILFVTTGACAQSVTDSYGPLNLDGGKVACKSSSGDEIKKVQTFEATQDRYFESFHVKPISAVSYVGPGECLITNKVTKKVKLALQNGLVVDVEVPYRYDVMAHADCGSGEARTAMHIAKGDHISVECEISGTLMKFEK